MSSHSIFLQAAACLAAWGLLVGNLPAQYRNVSASLNSEAALRRLGLVRAWQTQIEYDANRGKLAGITQYISDHTAQTIYEVTYPGGRMTFSDRDLDAFNQPLGPKGAKQKAEEWIENWKIRTRSKAEPEINEVVVPDVVLTAVSDRGMVQCLNAETGRTLWTNKVGSVRLFTLPAAINEKNVAVVNGSTLYMLDRADGHIIWERKTSHPAGSGLAMSDELVFVPMIDGHVEIFYIDEPRRPAANFQAIGRCLVQPVVFQDAVAWPTDRGILYVANSEVPGIRFRITAKDEAKGSPAAIRSAPTFRAGLEGEPPVVYFATSDGYLYSADTIKGSILHRFSAGEPITKTPVVVDDQVYVITDNGTLFCIGADDGQERWFLAGMKTFLAANLDRVYCLDRSSRLIGIDAHSGSPLGTVDVGSLDHSFLNTQSDRVYVSSTSGVVQCLREARQYYPLVHGGMEPKKKFPTVVQESEEPTEDGEGEMEKPEMEEEDPFGDKPAAKPAAKPAEKPADKPAEDEDPFGDSK
jgi:outer membrane protein assembly factor BamB